MTADRTNASGGPLFETPAFYLTVFLALFSSMSLKLKLNFNVKIEELNKWNFVKKIITSSFKITNFCKQETIDGSTCITQAKITKYIKKGQKAASFHIMPNTAKLARSQMSISLMILLSLFLLLLIMLLF